MVALALLAGVPLYWMALRPWLLRWGATSAELQAYLPGDELIANPIYVSTRAITIRASVGDVWPWLAQLGQEKGGFYSYDWLENLFGCEIRNADRIVPEFQSVKVGDSFRLHPKMPALHLARAEPNRALVIQAGNKGQATAKLPDATWAFVVQEIDPQTTRLLIRWRSVYPPTLKNRVLNQLLLEPIHFVMERKMMYGIKERAEVHRRSSTSSATVRQSSGGQGSLHERSRCAHIEERRRVTWCG